MVKPVTPKGTAPSLTVPVPPKALCSQDFGNVSAALIGLLQLAGFCVVCGRLVAVHRNSGTAPLAAGGAPRVGELSGVESSTEKRMEKFRSAVAVTRTTSVAYQHDFTAEPSLLLEKLMKFADGAYNGLAGASHMTIGIEPKEPSRDLMLKPWLRATAYCEVVSVVMHSIIVCMNLRGRGRRIPRSHVFADTCSMGFWTADEALELVRALSAICVGLQVLSVRDAKIFAARYANSKLKDYHPVLGEINWFVCLRNRSLDSLRSWVLALRGGGAIGAGRLPPVARDGSRAMAVSVPGLVDDSEDDEEDEEEEKEEVETEPKDPPASAAAGGGGALGAAGVAGAAGTTTPATTTLKATRKSGTSSSASSSSSSSSAPSGSARTAASAGAGAGAGRSLSAGGGGMGVAAGSGNAHRTPRVDIAVIASRCLYLLIGEAVTSDAGCDERPTTKTMWDAVEAHESYVASCLHVVSEGTAYAGKSAGGGADGRREWAGAVDGAPPSPRAAKRKQQKEKVKTALASLRKVTPADVASARDSVAERTAKTSAARARVGAKSLDDVTTSDCLDAQWCFRCKSPTHARGASDCDVRGAVLVAPPRRR
jgi:hypothetical protein